VGNEHFLWLADIAKSNMHSGPRAQVAALSNDEHAEHKKQKTAPPHPMHPSTLVVDATTGEKWSGDVKTVATLLTKQYADPSNSVVQTEFIQKFSGEYGFINKRLPVVKVQFSGPGNPRYYIEPLTGVLAAKVDDLDALEGKSFERFFARFICFFKCSYCGCGRSFVCKTTKKAAINKKRYL
jgi:hypothetical protein